MAGVKGKSGGRRANAGRKSKADEQTLLEQMAPYDDMALKTLLEALKAGESWAVKLWFAYRWGRPTQTSEVTVSPAPPMRIYFGDDTDDDDT